MSEHNFDGELPPASSLPSDWQPISTAPKDADLLLWFPNHRGAVRGKWNTDQYAKKPRPYWTSDSEFLWGKSMARAHQPTHWMPLPAPPTKRDLHNDSTAGTTTSEL